MFMGNTFEYQPFFMRSLYFILFITTAFISCKSEPEVEPDLQLNKEQQQKLHMTAVSLMDAIGANRPHVVMDQFDHKSFSKRLGKNFYQFSAQEQSLIMGTLVNTLGQSIATLTTAIANQQYVVRLLDTRQYGNVSVVTLDVVTQDQQDLVNFLVLYLKENKGGEFVLVNFYNVYDGKSFGQLAKAFLEYDFGSERIMRHLKNSMETAESAMYYERVGEYEKAYDQMNSMSKVFRDFGQFPVYRTKLASRVNDSIYLEELDHLKELTPNEQSRKLYDCLDLDLTGTEVTATQCWEEFQAILLERTED
ncbi:hypothetical protein AAU57_07965 [Nonlabens sp. YIK11]|nr:hypothetical protein AAU57_07965 [Nonlabens sp. YIK11]